MSGKKTGRKWSDERMDAVKNDTMEYIVSQIRFTCDNFKDRSAGSESERGCQEHFREQLSSWSDEVTAEEFTLHPKAFLGWIIPAAALSVAAVVFYWIHIWNDSLVFPILGLICITLALLSAVLEFGLYYRFIDPAFPKKQSVNVFARRRPAGEIKQRIIFGGHADAAYEMTYTLSKRKNSNYAVIFGAAAGMVFVLLISIAALVRSALNIAISGIWLALALVALAFAPFFMASMFFINWSRVVDGANDNLSGCLVAMGVLRELDALGLRLQNTEVCCLITGGEEEGLRGAMAFAKEHKEEFSEVETIFIALETLREKEQLQVYTRGICGTQKNSPKAAELLFSAGEGCDVRLEEAGIYPGATDAEAFSREGLQACGLGAVNHSPQTYYHTRYDTAGNISEECIGTALDICLQAACIYDAQIQQTAASATKGSYKKVSSL